MSKSDQTVYPALLPLWQKLQETIASVHAQNLSIAQPPRVSFVGRFKTGKSSLINALVGADVLPYNTDECTANLVELAHASQEKIIRLDGQDLNSSAEELITIEQFKSAVDLTAMPNKTHSNEANAFRYYLPSPLLHVISIVDTPGLDGVNSKIRKPGRQARERAIQQSHLCVLVLSKGGADDVACARLIHQYGIEMIVVLNMSDQYDSDERLEIQEQILSDLEREVGVRPSFYACSAVWQSGSEHDREKLKHQRRFFDEEDEAQWHQWDALVRRLSRPSNGGQHIALLTTIHHAFLVATRVSEQYDPVQQAESMFLEHLPRWKKMMPSLVGQTVLEMAVSAAKSNKPLPWKRLQNFGITPETIAPTFIVADQELLKLLQCYLDTLAGAVNLAVNTHSIELCKFLITDVPDCIKLLTERYTVPEKQMQALQRSLQTAQWYSQPLCDDFTYKSALVSLQARWNATPAIMDDDYTGMRKRLAAALA